MIPGHPYLISFMTTKGLLPTRDHRLFLDENLLGGKKVIFLYANIFSFGCHFRIKNSFRGFRVYKIQRRLFICLPQRQSQKMPSNAMTR